MVSSGELDTGSGPLDSSAVTSGRTFTRLFKDCPGWRQSLYGAAPDWFHSLRHTALITLINLVFFRKNPRNDPGAGQPLVWIWAITGAARDRGLAVQFVFEPPGGVFSDGPATDVSRMHGIALRQAGIVSLLGRNLHPDIGVLAGNRRGRRIEDIRGVSASVSR